MFHLDTLRFYTLGQLESIDVVEVNTSPYEAARHC
jgi:hypothetical protein